MTTVFTFAAEPTAAVVQRIRTGLPAATFVQIAARLNLAQEDLATRLGLVARTIHRKRKARATLSSADSEKIMRVARIWNSARSLFTTDEAIAQWLMTPAAPLGHVPPLDLLDTDVGAADVDGFIKGLAYGNFQ